MSCIKVTSKDGPHQRPLGSRRQAALRSEPGQKLRLKLGKPERLCLRKQYTQMYARGHRANGPHLTIFFRPNQLNFNRLGVSVSKKRFKLSTERNYIRRRLREAWRLNKYHLHQGYDIVISARGFNFRQGKAPVRLADIEPELLSLFKKAKMLS